MRRVYFDNAASTPMYPEVIEVMNRSMMDLYGNPSSIHFFGRHARSAIEDARKTIAQTLKASIGEIFFTSGGSEASNMALLCAVRDLNVRRIISSPIEHHCVLHTLSHLKSQGIEIIYVKLDQYGRPKTEHLKTLLQEDSSPTLVSLMHANNEIGTITDLHLISDICAEHGAFLHSDTVQTVGHLPIDLTSLHVHFITGSAHKFHGPKGVGFIYINNDIKISPLIHGGAQERNMRAGTENLGGIVGMAKALTLATQDLDLVDKKIGALKDYAEASLKQNFTNIRINGDSGDSLNTILSVTFPSGPKSDLLLFSLDIEGISASGGSACASGTQVESHVLSHLHPDDSGVTIRFSFSPLNTKDEIDYLTEKLKKVLLT